LKTIIKDNKNAHRKLLIAHIIDAEVGNIIDIPGAVFNSGKIAKKAVDTL